MFNKWTYGQIKLIPGFSSTPALHKNHRVNFFYYIKEKLQFSDITTLSFSSIAGRPDSCKMVNLLFVSLQRYYILTVTVLKERKKTRIPRLLFRKFLMRNREFTRFL